MQTQELGNLCLRELGVVMEVEDDSLRIGKAGNLLVKLGPECKTGGIVGAVVRDPLHDDVAWREVGELTELARKRRDG